MGQLAAAVIGDFGGNETAFLDFLAPFVGNGGAAGYGHQFFIGKLGLMDFIIKIYGNLLWKV